MFNIEIVKHGQTLDYTLSEIIRLKSLAWNYSLEKQMSWISEHISESDMHCLLSENGINVAYLNLIDLRICIDSVYYDAYGIGNVCSAVRGKGYGTTLMNFINHYIIEKQRIGILLCKIQLINFYNKSNWLLVPHSKLQCDFDLENIEMMIYNYKSIYQEVRYIGSSF